MRVSVAGLLAAGLVFAVPHPGRPAPARQSSTCAADDAVPTPPGYAGWERSSVLVWETVEAQGGIVPDIEEDHNHAPPAWWRYPSPLRSAELLAQEAKNPKGLFVAVAPGDLKSGDLLVRARGAGACGKMAVVAGLSEDQWMTVEPDSAAAADPTGQAKVASNPTFFAGKSLRPEVAAYRLQVKKDSTLGHVRELDRDLGHLERTIAERPPLVARKGRGVVDQKVHDLVDEAGSLIADAAFHEDRRVLTGRALALAAALDWPGAAPAAAAVLDEALQKSPKRADAMLARASVALMAGEYEKAAGLARAASAIPGVSPRFQYLLGRALLASGKQAEGLAALRRYLDDEPADPRARNLTSTSGKEPALAPAAAEPPGLRFSATPERSALSSPGYGVNLQWPITWRVVAQQVTPEAGMVIEFSTGRVLRDDGEAERGAVSLLIQRPGATEAAALARKGARNMFPDAKLKSLPALLPGSKREQFRERKEKSQRLGEVTTLTRNDAVIFLVLNASTATYPKLKDEYAAFVKSLAAPPPPPKPAPANTPI